MRVDIVTALPQLLESPLSHSIVKRAQERGLVEIHLHNLREYGIGNYRQIDDYPFGGDAGMVLMAEPIFTIIEKLKSEREYDEVIYLSPDGETFDQSIANKLSLKKNIIMLAGHYKGVDQRVREHLITREISIGDYVLSGGELAAAVLCDALVRLIPGAISDVTSALSDSFQDNLLAPPIYTRPAKFREWQVPEILLSGNHKLIKEWQEREALERTKKLRPDILKKRED